MCPSSTHVHGRSLSAMVAVLLLGACGTDEQSVGSTCEEGRCQQLSEGQMPLRCLTQETRAEVSVTGDHREDALPHLCLPKRYARGLDGLVSCEVKYLLPDASMATADGVPAACDDEPYLTGMGGEDGCLVTQLAGDGGDDAARDGDGWVYTEQLDDCAGLGAIAFTGDVAPFGGIRIEVDCVQATVMAGDHIEGATNPDERIQVAPDACTEAAPALAATGDLGQSCAVDMVPEGGFDAREAYLSTSHPGCQSGACLVFGVDGDPNAECSDDRCTAAEEVAERITCTCRCDSPDPDDEVCSCGEDQTCLPVFRSGPYAGSYCVSSSLVSQ